MMAADRYIPLANDSHDMHRYAIGDHGLLVFRICMSVVKINCSGGRGSTLVDNLCAKTPDKNPLQHCILLWYTIYISYRQILVTK